MKYYIGVDGGSTKTIFAVSDEKGKLYREVTRTGCSYQSIGVDSSVRFLNKEIRELLSSLEIDIEECAACCIGMPCFGENEGMDQVIADTLKRLLAPIPVYLVNDVEVGWAGAQECREGIHVAAGTGSIAFGKGKEEKAARCGGWNEFYGDEGSCYWIGRKAMGLFSKEADGRLPKGALYRIVKKELGLINDFYFTDVIRESWMPYRWKVAAFQMYAFWAVQEGDEAVARLYREAAEELGLMVKTIKESLTFSSDKICVTYSGGLFQVGDLIFQPFREEIEGLGCVLAEPVGPAAEGALLLAKKYSESMPVAYADKGGVRNL